MDHLLIDLSLSSLPNHPPISVFLNPQSLLISSSPTEQYPKLHHVFEMICHVTLHFFFSSTVNHPQSSFPAPLSIDPLGFASNVKFLIFKNSYPDISDPPSPYSHQ